MFYCCYEFNKKSDSIAYKKNKEKSKQDFFRLLINTILNGVFALTLINKIILPCFIDCVLRYFRRFAAEMSRIYNLIDKISWVATG